MEAVGYRWANYDTPFWANPNRSAGRWNSVGDDPTQYWGLHPLCPWAEYVRSQDIVDQDDLASIRSRVWTARLEFDEGTLAEVTYDNAESFGISAADLVADDHGPCRSLAVRLRSQHQGLIVPSAALPGTRNLVVFGGRAMSPYNLPPPDAEMDVPAALASEHGGPPPALLDLVCRRGVIHAGLNAWQNGDDEPIVAPEYPIRDYPSLEQP